MQLISRYFKRCVVEQHLLQVRRMEIIHLDTLVLMYFYTIRKGHPIMMIKLLQLQWECVSVKLEYINIRHVWEKRQFQLLC